MTKLPLALLDSERLAALNAAIREGNVRNQGDDRVTDALTEALVTQDDRLVYPVREGIPILLEEESIDWTEVSG